MDNTSRDLETCGVLGAFLKEGTYYVTTLIVPKQDSTSSSCQAVNEEEIFAIQNEQSLFPVGWIHTHPSQSCFMSSVDLHTQYSYQVMVPEAVAIVMAPTDKSRSYGFFRLSDPEGMNILRECQQTGFHTHKEPANGASIYEDCSSIYLNPNLRKKEREKEEEVHLSLSADGWWWVAVGGGSVGGSVMVVALLPLQTQRAERESNIHQKMCGTTLGFPVGL
ncbi:hypothetical protein E3N88_19877 [Mikania micrantha]|uniref:MPN domain-containing protein n=1 Tax=Mikania micrantha TaxID=192012 RepID=A0A5N6NPP3_9ASTR|nr:hypothetical protein E3N88_19877 [Mikania micrantha]